MQWLRFKGEGHILLLLTFSIPAWAGVNPVITTSTLDSGGDNGIHKIDVGRVADLVVAPDHSLHAAYVDSTNKVIKYASNHNGNWQIQTVEVLNGSASRIAISLAIDAEGEAHLLYVYDVDSLTQRVRYARTNLNQWQFETIDTIPSGWFSYGAKILFTTDGTLNYLYSGEKLHHATSTLNGNRTKTNNITSLDTSFWQATAKGNTLCVAQGTYWTLNLFLHDASGWATRTLSPANRIQTPPGLAFDNGGLLHALGVRSGEGLNHVTIDTSWNVVNSTTVDTYSGFSNIVLKIDTAGLMHTLYSSTNPITGISGGVEYMWIAPDGSNKFYILANGAYMARALGQDTLGNLHALYYDKDRGDLVYALIEYTPKPMFVTATSPANNASGISVNSTVTASFSEAMNSSTITTSTFFLKNGSTLVAGSVNYNADSRTATFTPSAKLNDSNTYTATITTGVQSLAGNPLVTTKTWSFTTASPNKNLTVTISGPGSVNSKPSGIACTEGICKAAITAGTAFTLMATPNTRSMFMGWSGACTNSSGDCILTMNNDKDVTANFAAIPPVRIAGTPAIYHKTLQDAYDAATSGSLIQVVEVELPDSSFIFNLDKIILLTGGYDINYSVKSGFSTMNGIMIIQRGTLTIENLIIK